MNYELQDVGLPVVCVLKMQTAMDVVRANVLTKTGVKIGNVQ